MRVLLTGAHGYIGRIVGPWLVDAGHKVVAVDIGLFQHAAERSQPVVDVRDMTAAQLSGFDCIVHLAGLSNDACANLQPAAAFSVNEMAAAQLAATARQARVPGFIFASSCSVYGRAESVRTEHAQTVPLSRYARTKLGAENRLRAAADGEFNPVVLRFGTVYGPSPSLRSDLVVNRMAACGVFDGRIVLHGDGLQRRPMVHVREIATAIEGVLATLPEAGGEIFNVAGEHGALQMRDIAVQLAETLDVPILRAAEMSDSRDYIVDGSKLRSLGIRLDTDFAAAVSETVGYIHTRFESLEQVLGAPQNRAAAVQSLVSSGAVDPELRWRSPHSQRPREALR